MLLQLSFGLVEPRQVRMPLYEEAVGMVKRINGPESEAEFYRELGRTYRWVVWLWFIGIMSGLALAAYTYLI